MCVLLRSVHGGTCRRVWECVHQSLCLWRSEQGIWCPPPSLCLIAFKQSWSLGCLARGSGSPCLPASTRGVTSSRNHAGVLNRCWGIRLGSTWLQTWCSYPLSNLLIPLLASLTLLPQPLLLVLVGVALGTRNNLGQVLVPPFPLLFWPWHSFTGSKLAPGYANQVRLCFSCFATCLPSRENVTCIYISVSWGQHHSLNLPGACDVSYLMKKLRYFFILGGIVLHPCQDAKTWKKNSRAKNRIWHFESQRGFGFRAKVVLKRPQLCGRWWVSGCSHLLAGPSRSSLLILVINCISFHLQTVLGKLYVIWLLTLI